MVLALGVPLELRPVEVDLSQVAGRVSPGLIVEVRGRRTAALASSGHGFSPNLLAKLDHGNEAVSAGAIPLLGPRVRVGTKGGQGAPLRRSETDRKARRGIVERLHHLAGQTLESVDVTPWRLPVPKIRF